MWKWMQGKIQELFGDEPHKSFTAIGLSVGGFILGLQEAGVIPDGTVQVLQEATTEAGRVVRVLVEETQTNVGDYGLVGAIFVTVVGLRRKGQASQNETKALRSEMVKAGVIPKEDEAK